MEKLKYIIKFISIIFLGIFIQSCDEDFEEINSNPNSLTSEVSPDLLLPTAIRTSADAYFSPTFGLEVGNLVIQHWARVVSLEVDWYRYESTFDAIWSNFYLNALPDLQEIYRLGEDLNNPNYQAIALIYKTWCVSVLTDVHGDIPYSEAVQGLNKNIDTPVFDPQDKVYEGMLADLETANNLIITNAKPVAGDILLNGNMLRWKKFGNSLRLRLLMRISNKVNVAQQIANIVNNPTQYPILESNSDNIQLNYLTDNISNFPFTKLDASRQNQFRVSETLVNKLKEWNDPRLPVYADLPEDTSIKEYVGVRNGAGGVPAQFSKPGKIFRQNNTPGLLITYAELQFILAEAAQRGLLSGDAKTFYNNGIKASLEQYGLGDKVNDYLNQPLVAFNTGKELQQIAEQKWAALYSMGVEAWCEWRRTGYPVLQPAVNNVNNDRIPVRMIYPITEQAANAKNYLDAVARQGENDINTKVWWQK